MNITMTFDEQSEIDQMKSLFIRKFRNTVDISTSSLFTDGMKVGTTKGAGYAFIENVVNNKLLTEENKLKLEKIINDNWDAVLEKAVRRAMQRRAVVIANELIESKS